jgi:nitroreductase
MDAIQAMKTRKSIRRFQDQAIAREVLEDIADCGRLAPCGFNRQGWSFVFVTDRELLRRIAGEARYGRFIGEAGACAAVFTALGSETMVEDGCAATENIIIAAQAHGLGSCWVNSLRKEHSEAVKRLLACPADYELVSLVALGYPAESKTTPKKELSEVLRFNSF